MRQALSRRRQYIALYRAVHSANWGYSHSAGQRKQRTGLSREVSLLKLSSAAAAAQHVMQQLSCAAQGCCVLLGFADLPVQRTQLYALHISA
jgi:hypothetical protein